MAEIYFWAVSMYFEPEYAHTRMIIARVVLLISLVDDTIDAYATMEETHILAEAVARFVFFLFYISRLTTPSRAMSNNDSLYDQVGRELSR